MAVEPPRLTSLLVANRGEIACRIIRTAKHLGIRSIAVYSDPDRGAPHVAMADAAVRLGPAPARESYLNAERILQAAADHDVEAIHPGYGLLSEDGGFAQAATDAGLIWVGPTPRQLELFGSKDAARELAFRTKVPLLPGTMLLSDLDEALLEADRIGYPVMLKAVGGGGGIGMAPCGSAHELSQAFARVQRAAQESFASSGVFLERLVRRARHLEVQVFGDGRGRVLTLGDRDCTMQRRRQKVIEEAPAPWLPASVREQLRESALALCTRASYRSAGTVEFVYDTERGEAYFLEVNARLQVEHTVTEEVFGIDLVEWMLRLAAGDDGMFDFSAPDTELRASGYAIQARVYAEDPSAGFRPSAGTITEVKLPEGVRVDHWIANGTEVTTAYDPLLAKVIAHGKSREDAIKRLSSALRDLRIAGIRTNRGHLIAALGHPGFSAASHTTGTLRAVTDAEARIEVTRAGTMTTVQDWPGRLGLWHVGVPPSGPMDDRSFRLGNVALGNPEGAPGLECTLTGPALRFTYDTVICLCGAAAPATLNGSSVPFWKPVTVPAGATLDIGAIAGPGLRTYVLFAGALDVPAYLGSAATFTLGGFGGHGGRALRPGDVLYPLPPAAGQIPFDVPADLRPQLTGRWQLDVLEGPHAAPEFFTEADITTFYDTEFEVHFNSARTGVRLTGPRPQWARRDGGEAGLHPSNIHDTPYSVGAVDYTGDLPILLGPDGPSLGGFVCPATVAKAERWKLGQLRPGDTVRFKRVNAEHDNGILGRSEATGTRPAVTYRRSGDDNLLIEYGEMVLDLGLRMRIHALAEQIAAEYGNRILDLTPGIRSLQVHFDPNRMTLREALALVRQLEDTLPATDALTVPSRTVSLPLSWDDPATRLAIERYMAGVRADAPWCPWNIEFIRRINGLDTVEDVYGTVFDASYLVLGLGDVYLGAPVATPLDPRHRLVTTKYNPARTWTPENAVGIGGAYLCIYGMEGPGGYQFVGRTIQVWSRYRGFTPTADATDRREPWLLRFFDRISWYPVSAEELLELRADVAAGRFEPQIEPGTFAMADYTAFLAENAESIAAFRELQTAAFGAESDAWRAAGEFDPRPESPGAAAATEVTVPEGGTIVEAPLSASVWQVDVAAGDHVAAGQRLVTLEAMKMETAIDAPVAGVVLEILVASGEQVVSGTALVVLGQPEANGGQPPA